MTVEWKMDADYPDERLSKMLAQMQDGERDWFWMVVDKVKAAFPMADHWTIGNDKMNELRIGERSRESKQGKTAFYFYRYSGVYWFGVRRIYGRYELLLNKNIEADIYFETHGSQKDFDRWFKNVNDVLSDQNLSVKGQALMPGQYVVDAEEDAVKEDVPHATLNQILFGPPGTGKTYHTIEKALEILAPQFFQQNSDNRAALKEKFDELHHEGCIRFVTFHQSFSYEDFVEGIRADRNDGDDKTELRFEVRSGVFRQICQAALSDPETDKLLGISESPRVWKISIGEANGEKQTRDYCFKHNEARIGWDHVGNLLEADLDNPAYKLGSNDKSSMQQFSQEMQKGDIVLCFESVTTIAAVGVVTGTYKRDAVAPQGVRADYVNVLPVTWLAKDINFNILKLNGDVRLTLKTVYPLYRIDWPTLYAALVKEGVLQPPRVAQAPKPYVLIIDEINRGNISRIFGELITLIEPSKRLGNAEALKVTLPYSKHEFGVPNNVYLIGTMNTADRSLTGIDIALRRRFEFVEMPPKPELLRDVVVEGVNIGVLLTVMNLRIDALIGADFRLGHAYFMPLKQNPSLALLGNIFEKQILPLLQEYFFDDWQRIAWVLNDHAKTPANAFIVAQTRGVYELFGNAEGLAELPARWRINQAAFTHPISFLTIIDAKAESTASANAAPENSAGVV